MRFPLMLVSGVLGGLLTSQHCPAADFAKELRTWSTKIPILDPAMIGNDHLPGTFDWPPLTEAEKTAAKAFWKRAHAASAAEIDAALRDGDPKVRTLALAAAYWAQRPGKWLPTLAAMAGDEGESFASINFEAIGSNRLLSTSGDPSEMRAKLPLKTMTVGAYARWLVEQYLEASGFHYGMKGAGDHPGFADYWRERKERDYGLGWFRVELQMAAHGMRPVGEERSPGVAAVRKRIDALPSPDREWILLALAVPEPWSEHSSALASERELIEAMQRLGHDALLRLFRRQPISTDPDMQFTPAHRLQAFGYGRIVCFVLRHAAEVLEPRHADILLTISDDEWTKLGTGEFRFITPQWAIAAADLAPDRAPDILRSSWERFAENERYDRQDNLAMLAIAKWRHFGMDGIEEIAEWFFTPAKFRGFGFGRHRLCDFMHAAEQRELLVALLRDERLEHLNWGTLERLAKAANQHTDKPVLTHDELSKPWHPYGIGRYGAKKQLAHSKYPKESAELEKQMTLWRKKLRAFAESRPTHRE